MYTKANNSTNPNLILRDDLFCQYCGKKCKNLNSLKQHECRCKNNPNRLTTTNNLKNQGWAKGLCAETDERIRHSKNSRLNYYKDHPGTMTGKHHTAETKAIISEKAKGNTNWVNSLGKTGFGKRGYYKGIHCDSTYELAFIIYCLDHNINIKRCDLVFKYIYNNAEHKYYPDFIIDDNLIIEIKGFWQQKLDYKIEAVKKSGYDIKVCYHKDLEEIFKYIYEIYGKKDGKDIADLYDK